MEAVIILGAGAIVGVIWFVMWLINKAANRVDDALTNKYREAKAKRQATPQPTRLSDLHRPGE